jgi:hypothetical protein
MDFQERRLAQIVRDFMEAYALADDVARRLSRGDLDFLAVQRLVGDSEDSALYRLKEETHALFRFDESSSEEELHAEELFDLAVGALFHEAMKFREGYYLTTTYGPRLEGMMRSGVASGPLADSFRKVFEGGNQRMRESAEEARELFDETRDQLLIVLQHLPRSRPVARSLVENPERTAQVFETSVDELLAAIYGSAGEGYRLAASGLLESGHFEETLELVEREDVLRANAFDPEQRSFARGMHRHYMGDASGALDDIGAWIASSGTPEEWRRSAARALEAAAASDEREIASRARSLARQLTEIPSGSASSGSEARALRRRRSRRAL